LDKESLEMIKGLKNMTSLYIKQIGKGLIEADKLEFVGKKDAKQDLNERLEALNDKTLMECLNNMINSVTF
jgi:hypothetical protein